MTPNASPAEERPVRFLHEGLAEQVDGRWRLIGSKCRNCGDVRFPPAKGCPACHAPEEALGRHVLGEKGSVYAFSRVMKAPAPFQGPYLLAWVQLPEGPRVLAQLDCPWDAEVFGAPCELTTGVLWETNEEIVLGYKFRIDRP